MAKEERSVFEISGLQDVEQELRIRLAQQEALNSLGQSAMRIQDFDQYIDEVVNQVTQILDADYCELLELLPDNNELVLKAGSGWKPGYVGIARVRAGAGSQGGFTIQSGVPVIVEDLATETRFSPPKLFIDHGVTSGITVIILGRQQPYGILGVFTREKKFFSSHDANFLQSVANLLASALDRLAIEQELRASRDQLSVVFEGIAEGITVQDQMGRIRFANDAAAHLLGFKRREDLLKTPTSEINKKFEILDEHGEKYPTEQLPGLRALRGEASASEVLRFRVVETGEMHWSIVHASPIYDPTRQEWLAVNIFQDITDLKLDEQAQHFLAEVGSALVTSNLDSRERLDAAAHTAVEYFSDWCSIHLVDPGNGVQEIAVAHKDPEKIALVRYLQQKYPADPEADSGLFHVIRTGQAEYYSEITDDMMVAMSRSEEHLRLIHTLEFHSAMLIPMISRDQVVGVITLVWSESRRSFGEREKFLGMEFARRAALAIDNARLFQEAQALNAELENKVNRRTAQLERLIDSLRLEITQRHQVERELQKNEALFEDLFDLSPDAICLVDKNGIIMRINDQLEMIFGYKRAELLGKSVEIMLPRRFRAIHTKHRDEYLVDPKLRSMGVGLDIYGLHKNGHEFPVEVSLGPVKIDGDWMVICAIRDMTAQKYIQAELAEVQHRLIDAQEAERLRLARELHDNSIQELFSLSYLIDDVQRNLSVDGNGEVSKELQTSKEMIHHTILGLRNMSVELRPPILTSFGLEQAVHSYLERFQELHPEIVVHQEIVEDSQTFDERLRLSLYRIFQNAISNVARHAEADNIWVKLNTDENQISLEVQDDGKGFDLPSRWVELARQGHLGLVGTEERVKAIGGQLDIVSSPGKGTLIRVTVPLKKAVTQPEP